MITVKECTKAKEWDNGKGQKVPIYKVELSDGTVGESFGKEIPLGTNVSEITIEEGQYGKKFKWAAPKNGFSGGKPRAGNESFALSYAKDMACAHISNGKDFGAKEVLAVAELFYTWLENKKK